MNRQGKCKKGMYKMLLGGNDPLIKFSAKPVNNNGVPLDEQLPYDAAGAAYQADLNNRQRYMSDPRNELAASAIGKDMPGVNAYDPNKQYTQAPSPNGYVEAPNAKPRLSAILSGLNVGIRGISEKYNRNREDQYTRANIANPYSGILGYNDGQSDNVKYGYNNFKRGGKMPDGGLLPAPVTGFKDLSGSAAYVGTGGGDGFGAVMPYSWQENGFGKNSQTWEGYPTKDPNIGWTDWRKKSFGKEELMRFGTNVEFYKHNMPYNNNYHNKNQHILNATSSLEKPSDIPKFAKKGGMMKKGGGFNDVVSFIYDDDDKPADKKIDKKEEGATDENTAPDNSEQLRQEQNAQLIAGMMQDRMARNPYESDAQTPSPMPPNVEQLNADQLVDRIGGTEGGRTGKKTALNSSARGRYQIIDGTRASIHKKYFGHMSDEEFNAQYDSDPNFERDVAKAHVSELLGKYGVVGATKAWYTGNPNYPDNEIPGKSAGNKITAGQYVRKTLGKFEKGGSIVDYLKGQGKDSSKESRAAMASQLGVKDYDYSADKNIELLNILRNKEGKTSSYQGDFKSAFRKARSSGEEAFNWNGKKYNTELAKSQPVSVPQKQSASQPIEAPQVAKTQEEPLVNLNTYNVARPSEKPYSNNYNPFAYAPKVAAPTAQPVAAPRAKDAVTPNNNKGRTSVVNVEQVNQTKPRRGSYPTLAGEKVTPTAPRPKPTEESNSLGDYAEMAKNYIGRTYDKYFGDQTENKAKLKQEKWLNIPATMETEVDGKMVKSRVNENVPGMKNVNSGDYKDNVPEITKAPPISTGDTIWDFKERGIYHLPEVMDLTRIKMGARNRGDLTPLESDGIIFTAFDKQRIVNTDSAKLNPDNTYVAVDDEGNVRAGKGSDFSGKRYQALQFNSHNITGFSKNPDGSYRMQNADGAAKNHSVPMFKTPTGETNSNFLLKDGVEGAKETYGSITGGKALFTSPDYKKQVMISGSVDIIDKELQKFMKENQLSNVNYMMLDNGSYARGFRKKDGKLSEKDLKEADNRNSNGNSGFYLKGKGFKTGGRIGNNLKYN